MLTGDEQTKNVLRQRAPNKAWCVLRSHRLLAGREASPVLVRVRPPECLDVM